MNRFLLKSNNGIDFLVSPNIEKLDFINHFFSTRIGGVSTGEYSSLNLGIYTEDNEENIKNNFKGLLEASGFKSKKVFHLRQIHGNDFCVVNNDNVNELNGSEGDAIITSTPGIAIGVLTADCVPILIVDVKNKIVSAIHAGWKGTNKLIVEKVLKHMINIMGSDPKDIVGAIGPSIGACCFEVGEEVGNKFSNRIIKSNKYFVDLKKENLDQMVRCGVNQKNVMISEFCTKCNEDLFYSYRRDNSVTGRLGAFIEINGR